MPESVYDKKNKFNDNPLATTQIVFGIVILALVAIFIVIYLFQTFDVSVNTNINSQPDYSIKNFDDDEWSRFSLSGQEISFKYPPGCMQLDRPQSVLDDEDVDMGGFVCNNYGGSRFSVMTIDDDQCGDLLSCQQTYETYYKSPEDFTTGTEQILIGGQPAISELIIGSDGIWKVEVINVYYQGTLYQIVALAKAEEYEQAVHVFDLIKESVQFK
ncbi:hypothetical protein ACFL04_01545 [Patescibacteria group bacterium]